MIKIKHTLAIRMVYSVLKNMGIMVASRTQYLAVQKQDPVHYWYKQDPVHYWYEPAA